MTCRGLGAAVLMLASVPSTAAAQLCRGGDGVPLVVGTVRDADHGIPIVGARVNARWDGPGGAEGRGARTDADGRFALCDIPEVPRLVLVARAGAQVGPERVVERSAGDAAAAVDLQVGLDDPTATAGLYGAVTSRDGRRGIANAAVSLEGHGTRRVANGEGGFVFNRVPPGSYVLRVEHLAYAAYADTVHLAPGRPLQIRIPLDTEPIPLEGIEVTVRSTIWMRSRTELFERMERGPGHFITRGEIAERGDPPLSALLRGVAGVSIRYVEYAGRQVYYPVIRGAGIPSLYVDGARVLLDPTRGHGIDDFLASDVDVIEIQRGPASIPIGMSGSCAGCGMIHIWTRAP